jgi:hypothetical protein
MAKKKNGKNKGKITRERNKVIASLKAQAEAEQNKQAKRIKLDNVESL